MILAHPMNANAEAQLLSFIHTHWKTPIAGEITQINPRTWSLTHGDCSYIVKKLAGCPDCSLESAILTLLKEAGLPVAPPLPTVMGAHTVEDDGATWVVFPRLSGNSRHLDSLSVDEAFAIGVTLALLHQGLDSISTSLPLAQKTLSFPVAYGPTGIIHRDFHPLNILLDRGRVTGVVDFELLCLGPRMFDLAYYLASLLSESWPRVSGFCSIVTPFVAGYLSITPLTHDVVFHITPLLGEVEQLFITLAKEIGNHEMERSAHQMKAWFSDNRADLEAALSSAWRSAK
jgi:Ser/Thr protein kinase RdoA (MazF antagonist)